MEIGYTLDEDDFLQYQLYTSSKSKTIKRKRLFLWILIPLLYLGLAIFNYVYKNELLFPLILIVFAILWFIIYPIYSKSRYKKHYKKHVKNNYKTRFFKPIELNINQNFIEAKDFTGESKINISEIEYLVELKNQFLIHVSSNASIIIPKRDLKEIDDFKNEFIKLSIPIKDELNWKWK